MNHRTKFNVHQINLVSAGSRVLAFFRRSLNVYSREVRGAKKHFTVSKIPITVIKASSDTPYTVLEGEYNPLRSKQVLHNLEYIGDVMVSVWF